MDSTDGFHTDEWLAYIFMEKEYIDKTCHHYKEMQDMGAHVPYCDIGEYPLNSCEKCWRVMFNNQHKPTHPMR